MHTWASTAPTLLVLAAVMYCAAALAEACRFAVLMRNRSRLIPPPIVSLSDAAVWIFGVLAVTMAVFAALACAAWLVDIRRDMFRRVGTADTRRVRVILLGCLVPVVNLVMPGVFLTELAASASAPTNPTRMRRVVRIWWGWWVTCMVATAIGVWWRFADTVQAKANGVQFAVVADLLAAGAALATLWLIKETVEGRNLFGRVRTPQRWLAGTGPAEPVIEPIRPAHDGVVSSDLQAVASGVVSSDRQAVTSGEDAVA